MAKALRKKRSKNYKDVIEVNVPVRFYWNKDDTFDGIEIGPLPKGEIDADEKKIMTRLLDKVGALMDSEKPRTRKRWRKKGK